MIRATIAIMILIVAVPLSFIAFGMARIADSLTNIAHRIAGVKTDG